MMQTLNPYTSTARTAEIMARYRPIAPRPETPGAGANGGTSGDNSPNPIPENIRNSPYLMNVWPHLQARPTRTRKRGRTALAPPTFKRTRTCLQGLSPPYQVTASPAKTLALQGFAHDPDGLPKLAFVPNLVPLKCGLDTPVATPSNTVSTLPFLPNPNHHIQVGTNNPPMESCKGIDLNRAIEIPEELDFLPQLQGPTKSAVISPQAIRPVGSTISVGRISEDPCGRNAAKQVVKKPEEVEKEVESETLPAVVSDSNNKVRLTNSAYNEMIGQPECCWLDCMPCGGSGGVACKRIGGEVVLNFKDSGGRVPLSSNGFTCWVRIEWGKDGKKNVVNAFCDTIRLACESKDYLFEWRFHIREASESASNA
ncbi:hypothetical protein M9H77_32366 [Catharanthus roseus]|uniref:Uncharacterized protein n=1 Tax=Catharanthus roseus TaxID=4058 RepID=A0ACC0A321_CATRO|nr:hypothetical protein M9H77_32366 [Catharanthus roseus]